MASNKENMRQAMKELLGLVGMTKEEKVEETFETDLNATRQEVAQTVEKTLHQEPPVEITVEPRVEPRKEPVRPAAPRMSEPQPAPAPRPQVQHIPQPEPAPEFKAAPHAEPAAEAEPRVESRTVRSGLFGFGRAVTPPPAPTPAASIPTPPVPVAEPKQEPVMPAMDEDEQVRAPFIRPNATVIAAGASFFGDLRVEGDVEVLGKLKGNLEATGNVRITGKVLGDVKGAAIQLNGCAVQGNITSTSSVALDSSAMVVGDVLATDIESDGKIKGNLQIARAAIFFPAAVLAGNVTACTISMNQGARIQGAMRIAEDPETNALFGDGLDI